jgi:hypothetical protein
MSPTMAYRVCLTTFIKYKKIEKGQNDLDYQNLDYDDTDWKPAYKKNDLGPML